MMRFTAHVRWPGGDVEEIDVDADSPQTAREVASEILREEYCPGGEVVAVERRTGLYW